MQSSAQDREETAQMEHLVHRMVHHELASSSLPAMPQYYALND